MQPRLGPVLLKVWTPSLRGHGLWALETSAPAGPSGPGAVTWVWRVSRVCQADQGRGQHPGRGTCRHKGGRWGQASPGPPGEGNVDGSEQALTWSGLGAGGVGVGAAWRRETGPVATAMSSAAPGTCGVP